MITFMAGCFVFTTVWLLHNKLLCCLRRALRMYGWFVYEFLSGNFRCSKSFRWEHATDHGRNAMRASGTCALRFALADRAGSMLP